jgi:heme a synthase
MTSSTNNVWLHRFACALVLATLFLVALGGVVTTKGVGMAVPDWPTTYGDHMFLFPPSKWMAGIFYEHSHRLWASLVGLLAAGFALWVWIRESRGIERVIGITGMIAALGLMGVRTAPMFIAMAVVCVGVIAYATWRAVREERRLRWLGLITLAAVIVQGVLGGLRVILDEHGWGKEFGVFHALLAQFFFLLVCSLALITSPWFLLASVLIVAQLAFGATMRHQHQGLAVPDFPLAYGEVWPATDAAAVEGYNARRLEMAGENPITAFGIVMHMVHRWTGFVVLAAIIGCAFAVWRNTQAGSVLRKVTGVWCAVVVIQVVLGIFTILSDRKVDVTTLHVALGAVTFAIGWLLVLATKRLSVANRIVPATETEMAGSVQWKHA